MADFDIVVCDSGTLNLPIDERLQYSESGLLSRNARGVLYNVTSSGLAVLLPAQPDDAQTERWFQRTLTLTRALHSQHGSHALPLLALARHEVFACMVVVMPAPLGSFLTTVQQLQRDQQFLAAERLALKLVIDLLDVMTALEQSHETLALHTLDALLFVGADGAAAPTLVPWGDYLPASEVVALNANPEIGRWLYRLLLGFNPQPPFSPFDDTTWQGRALPYTPQGVLSVGLRYILTALFHSPADQRFLMADTVTFQGLRKALFEWYSLTLTLGSVIDQQSPASLERYSATLPKPYQFRAESAEAQAIWLDLWLRIHQTTDAPELLSSQDTTRSHALLRAKVAHNVEAQSQEAISRAFEASTTAEALAILEAQQQRVRDAALSRDVTLWGLWQHLGRWRRLLGLNAPREVIRHIGTVLHRPVVEDTPNALDVLVNTLHELNAPDLLHEVQVRQSALAYRQNGAWAQYSPHFLGMLANLPDYLQLPSAVQYDLLALPYTLQGQLISRLSEVMAQMSEALAAGNYDVALALGEYARALPLPPIERHAADEALAPLNALAAFLKRPEKPLADFNEGARLLETPPVQADAALRYQLEAHLLTLADSALQQVHAAAAARDWQSVRRAAPAHRLLTCKENRHLIEQLRLTHRQEARSLEQSAALHTFEQIYETYQDLWLIVRQHALSQPLEALEPAQQQAQASHIMHKLQQALELGLPMDDIIRSDETTRQQWQQIVHESIQALQRVEHVTQDVEQIRQRLQGDGGFAAQLQALQANLEGLREQIDGSSSANPGLLRQLQHLRAQLSDLERAQANMIEQAKREMRVTQDDMQRQLEAQEITLQRHTQQITSSSNLLQDARERLQTLEQRLERIQQHESQLLCTYLDAMPRAERLDSLDTVLDTVDGLVYALRRCPVQAYDEGCHAAWLAQFNALRQRFDALAKGRLSWRDRQTLKANLRSILALFNEVEQEAAAKAAAYIRLNTRPADHRS
ncbi:hypothetical protein VZO05_16065 (plasmid) [Aggregatilineales bacterium SYSU G02658]